MSRQAKKSFLIALLLSLLLIHVPLFIFLWKMQDWDRAELTPLNARPEMVMVDLNASSLPIADIDKPEREEVPDQASVQSLYNSKVKQETVAPRTARKEAPLGQSQTVQPKTVPQKPAEKSAPKQVKQAKALETKQPPKPPASPTAMPAPNQSASLQDELRALQNREQAKEQQKLARFDSKTPLPTNFGFPMGGSSGDYLPNYKIGSRTYLNALANPAIGYFVELKRKFKFAWNPVPALRNQIHQISKGKIEVVWGVSVDPTGRIQDLVLIRSSGMTAYDAEARRTIMSSAPFSSPPANLLEAGKELNMAWTFVVYL